MMQCVRASSVADGFAVPILPDWFTSRQDDFDYDTVIYVVRVHILSALAWAFWTDFVEFDRLTDYVVPVRVQSIAICVSVCLSVCFSARISQKPHDQISPYFLYMSPVAVARSFSDANAISYVLPVLWMTSCLHIMEQIGQNQRQRVRFSQLARWRHRGRSLPSQTALCCAKVLRHTQHNIGHFWDAHSSQSRSKVQTRTN